MRISHRQLAGLLGAFLLLTACSEDGEEEVIRLPLSPHEPANHSFDDANVVDAYFNYGTRHHGFLKAGESDYYKVVLDFFSDGTTNIGLTDLNENLDLELYDRNRQPLASSGNSGVSDEQIQFTFTYDYACDCEDVYYIKVKGATDTEESRFTLTLAIP